MSLERLGRILQEAVLLRLLRHDDRLRLCNGGKKTPSQ
jgi:hypothetical protein